MPDSADTVPPAGMTASVTILGLGLIGGSVGLSLRGKVGRVTGWDPSPAVACRSLQLGAVDDVSASAQAAAREADTVFLCAPLHATLPLLAEIVPVLPAGAIVTDIGSVKGPIVEGAEAVIGGRFVGGHPMAGSDEHGIDAARYHLFRSACWFLTPTERTDPAAITLVEALVRTMEATPRRCDTIEHDRIVSVLSHLPHVLAFGLAQTAADLIPPDWHSAAAGSFRDGSRVAGSNPDLWRTVFRLNQKSLLAALDAFDGWTAELRRAILEGDDEKLRRILERAHEARQAFASEL